jgi:hypothetical protein
MASAHAGHATRQNLAALLHELRQNVRSLIVDEVHLLDAELADLLLTEILALAAARATRTSWTTASRAGIPAWATVSASGTAVSTARAVAAFATRSTRALRLLLFLCHACLPFGIDTVGSLVFEHCVTDMNAHAEDESETLRR